jgi:hypothetical protein
MNQEQAAAPSNLKMPDLQNVSDTANNVKDTLTKSVGDLGQKFSDVRGTLTKTLDDFSSTSAADAGKEFLEANTIVAKFSFVIIVLIGFLFLMRLGMIIISYIFSPSESPYLIKGLAIGSSSREIIQDPKTKDTTVFLSENERTGLELTYSVWLYLDGVNTDTELKHIFSKGSIDTTTGFGTIDATTKLPGASSTLNKTYNAPGLYTFRNGEGGNNLRVYMDSFITPTTTSDLSGQVQMVDISGVPINKWFNTTIRVENRVLDVYMNGVLTKRKDLETIPRQNFYSVFICQNGGFGGYLSDLRYFNKSLNVFEINSIVNSGPNLKFSSDSDAGYNKVPDNLHYLSNNWYSSNT